MNGPIVRDIDIRRDGLLEIRNFLQRDYRDALIKDIKDGISRQQKTIPCKYFYDDYGCHLFDQICCTPEYYLTETELLLLDESACDIMNFFIEDRADLVELGSGSNKKIRKLFDAIDADIHCKIRYVPVDISEHSIREASEELIKLYENIPIFGIVADFNRQLEVLPNGRKMVIFLGSTMGNFTENEAIAFLRNISNIMTPDDWLLLGLDMLKPVQVIEAAYNDKMGLTEKFNLNILVRINRELHADFNIDDFNHVAFFNREKERIEMHLEAKRAVRVTISDLFLTIDFKKGETIHTEICKKYSRESASKIFAKAGLSETAWFTDPEEWFSLVTLQSTG